MGAEHRGEVHGFWTPVTWDPVLALPPDQPRDRDRGRVLTRPGPGILWAVAGRVLVTTHCGRSRLVARGAAREGPWPLFSGWMAPAPSPSVKVMPFANLMSLLGPSIDSVAVLRGVQKVAMLVQGNWVVKR